MLSSTAASQTLGPYFHVQVSQVALPVFLERARAVLGAHAATPNQDRLGLDMALCCLDALGAMTLAPGVTDSVLPPQSRVKARPTPARMCMLAPYPVHPCAARAFQKRCGPAAWLSLLGKRGQVVPSCAAGLRRVADAPAGGSMWCMMQWIDQPVLAGEHLVCGRDMAPLSVPSDSTMTDMGRCAALNRRW